MPCKDVNTLFCEFKCIKIVEFVSIIIDAVRLDPYY